MLRAAVVVSNADPKRNLDMLEPDAVPSEYRERIERWKVQSSVVKLNAALTRLPTFAAAGDLDPLRAMISIQHGLDAARRFSVRAGRARDRVLRAVLPRMTPRSRRRAADEGAFCHYAPYELAEGRLGGSAGGDRRDDPRLDHAAYAPDVHACVEHMQVLGPPTSRPRSASPAARSSRARRCPTRCGTGGSRGAPPSRASTCAVRRPTPRAR